MLKLKWFCKFDASCQVSKYLCEAEDLSLSTAHLSDPLRFWAHRENIYDKLSLVAEDIISAPASQAYVESLFGQWHAHHWSQKSNDQVIGDESMLKA